MKGKEEWFRSFYFFGKLFVGYVEADLIRIEL